MDDLVTKWARITPGTEDRDNIIAAIWVDGHAELFKGRQLHGEIRIPIGGPYIELSVDEMANIPNVLPLPPAPEVKALVDAARAVVQGAADEIRSDGCECPACKRRLHLADALAPFLYSATPPAEVAERTE